VSFVKPTISVNTIEASLRFCSAIPIVIYPSFHKQKTTWVSCLMEC